MLSIQPLKSAEGAADYYLNVANYYENDSKSIRWLGEGAKTLGLYGKPVETAQMISLLKGQMPDGTQLGRIDKEGIHHRPGFDMTVTAPKSFSILLESGADPRLADVLDQTTEWFVKEMEHEFAQARQIVNGKIEYIDTNNFVVAAFRQPNSRANDPNSHVHLVVQNMTQCPDGKFRSLASDMDSQQGVVEQIMKDHIYGGLKFRNKLANLTKELGYPIASDGDGFWEIRGVPEDVLTHFSKRREEIEASMDEHGWSSAKGAAIAAKKTRADKEIVDFDEWKKSIVAECQERGFDPHKLVESSYQKDSQSGVIQRMKEKILEVYYGKEVIELNHARLAVHVAIESVSQQHAVFDLRTLKKDALKHTIASNTIVDEKLIDKAIEEQVANQQLYQAIHPYTQKPLLTTPWQLTMESESIQRIENGKGAVAPICSKQMVTDFIVQKEQEMQFALSPSQKKAMMGFLTSTDRFMAIQGYAGTGKTTMLRLTQELALRQGYEIRGVTAGSAAAHELRTKGGLDASTFARELGRLKKQQKDLSKTIFVVDEASMLSNPQGHKMIKIAEQFNTQLKIIGDKAQLPTPSSGKWFSITQEYGIDTVSMTDNLRQKDAELKESAIHASRGEIYDAVEKLSHVAVQDTYLKRITYIADKWLSLSPDERRNTLCFAPTHKNRQDITQLFREGLKKEGVLQGHEYKQTVLKERNLTSKQLRFAAYYTKNDVIRFNHAISRHDIKAGDYLTVGEMSAHQKNRNTLLLIRDNGKSLTLDLALLPKFKTEHKDLERPIEVYKQQELLLMQGERILFKRNFEQQKIRNSELGHVSAVTADGIAITTDENHTIFFKKDAKELQHLDHGYVLTTYAAQGKDKKRGLGLIESFNRFAATIQNYYVETTRGIDEMIVVTDDKEHLVKAITCNDSDKYSSLDMVSSETLHKHELRFKENKNSIGLQNVIEKKLSKEGEWAKLEHRVEQYAKEKQQAQKNHAAKSAYLIVNDANKYRIARERLGFKTHTYRRDALAFETSKLFHSLPMVEKKYFSVVRQYVSLNQQIARRVDHNKKIEPLTHDVLNDPLAKEHAVALKRFTPNQAHLQTLTAQRNELAGIITKELDRFKPYLTHFSIGELNRLALPQHEIGEQTKKAAHRLTSLARHASFDVIRVNVVNYLNACGEARELLAAQIKRDAALSHRYVLAHAKQLNQEPSHLWKSIHHDAQAHRDRLFRQGLNSEGRLAFDTIKKYKTIQQELKSSCLDGLAQQDKKEGTYHDMSTQLAHQITQNKALHEVFSYFKLNDDALIKQTQKHHYRENVRLFVASQSHFNARLDAVKQIKHDIHGHYPFLKEANIQSKVLGQYIRVSDRQERLLHMSADEKQDYKQLLNYKKNSLSAYKAWQIIHQSHAVHDKNKLISNAVALSSRRDSQAFHLQKSPYLETLLAYENMKCEKIMAHASSHHLKLRELNELNKCLHTLATQYEQIASKNTPKAIAAWKNDWLILCKQINRASLNKMYQFARNDHPLNLNLMTRMNNDLSRRFDYSIGEWHDKAHKPISHILTRTEAAAKRLDANMLNEALMVHPEKTYASIFGEPKSQTPKEMRYSGGLIVTLKGKGRGLWHDFSEGIGGAPIHAIMAKHRVEFKEALNIAAQLSGVSELDNHHLSHKESIKHIDKLKMDRVDRKNKIVSARSIWSGTTELKGTLAEKYLSQHRGIDNINSQDMRYWPEGSPWKNVNEHGVLESKVNKIPALVIAAKNEKGEITGVQRIYLDKDTAQKNTFMDNAKLSKGIIEGSCGVIQKGMRGSALYIAEGPETAASIAMADRKSTVLVSFGISNIKNLNAVIKNYKAKEIIIAADNDGRLSKTDTILKDTIESFKQNNINVRAIFPDSIAGKNKTDWNDVLVKQGVLEVQKQLIRNDITHAKSFSEKSIDASATMPRASFKSSPKISEMSIQNFRDLEKTANKTQQLSNLVDSYHKHMSRSNERNNTLTVEKSSSVDMRREVDLEL